MKRLLLGYDGSEPAREAARMAARLAVRSRARLTILTAGRIVTPVGTAVVPTMEAAAFVPTAEEGAEVVRTLGVDPEVRVALGAPADVLVDVAANDGYDLVVIGHRALRGIRGLARSSIATKVATAAPCPVLVVPGTAPETVTRVLVGIGGPEDARAAEAAAAVARVFAAHISLVSVLDPAVCTTGGHVLTTLRLRARLQQESLETLAKVGEVCLQAGVAWDAVQMEGRPAEAILCLAGKGAYDLVAVGRRGLSGIERFFLGSVSGQLLARVNIPVLVVGVSVRTSAERWQSSRLAGEGEQGACRYNTRGQ